MSRIDKAFALKAKIAYLTAGDGDSDYFMALVRAGANVLEIGIPFSDPVADGLSIQLAMERSLKNGTSIAKVLEIVREIRAQTDAAIILFTYFNPIQNNLEKFLHEAKEAGADGILVVDLPFEEGAQLRFLCDNIGLAQIAVSAPSSSPERIEQLSTYGSGFLYYACRKGTTGTKDELPEDIVSRINEVKKHSKLPVAVGFGVSNNNMVNKILEVADGCVIGSYFVNQVAKNVTSSELEQLAKEVFHVNTVEG
jgi:tryptophan synthase alpha chain